MNSMSHDWPTHLAHQLILNVDGCIAVCFVDLLRDSGAFTPEEADEYTKIGTLNGLFVLGRSIGFIGHHLGMHSYYLLARSSLTTFLQTKNDWRLPYTVIQVRFAKHSPVLWCWRMDVSLQPTTYSSRCLTSHNLVFWARCSRRYKDVYRLSFAVFSFPYISRVVI